MSEEDDGEWEEQTLLETISYFTGCWTILVVLLLLFILSLVAIPL